MKKIKEFEGLTGNLLAFKEEVENADKVTFVGVPGVCTPFAELFAYAIRDKESVFISGKNIESAKKLELKPEGMQLTEKTDPQAEVVALLGGLSMPKSKISAEEIQEVIDKILKPEGKLIGLCYMDMFKKADWDKKLDFDCIIDGTLTGNVFK
ncbi:MAG: DUF2124 family protein [Methanomicrobiales archaeon]